MNKLIILLLLLWAASTSAVDPFDVRKLGAKGDGTTLDTAVIQTAIDTCAGDGGGTVLFPAGRYLSGTIHLASGVTLPVINADRVDRLNLDAVKFTRVAGVNAPIITTNVVSLLQNPGDETPWSARLEP